MLSACFLVHFILGAKYTFGNYIPYILSYTRQRSHPSDLRYGESMWLYSTSVFFQGLSSYFGGWLERKLGPRLSTLTGSAVIVSGVLLSYFTVQHSFWLLLLTYGILYGTGTGIAFIGPLVCAMRWFPKWKGLASGFISSGFGLSALLFNVIQTAFINPANAKPSYAPYATDPDEKYFIDAGVLDRVPYSFLFIGVIYAVILVMVSLLLFNPPEPQDNSKQCLPADKETAVESNHRKTPLHSFQDRQCVHSEEGVDQEITGDDSDKTCLEHDSEVDHASDSEDSCDDGKKKLLSNNEKKAVKHLKSIFELATKEDNNEIGLTPWQMLWKPNFYLLWTMMFLHTLATTTILSVYKLFGISFIADDHFLTAVGSVSAIFNASGRIFWGVVADVSSHKVALVSLNGIMAALMLTFYASTEGGEAMYFIWVCGISFCIGGVQPIFPKAVADSFGPKHISENYGLFQTVFIPISFITALLTQFLLTHLKWYGLFLLNGGFLIISYFISMMYQPKVFF